MKTFKKLKYLIEDAYLHNVYAKSIKNKQYYKTKYKDLKEAIKLIDSTKTSKVKYEITYDVTYHDMSCVYIEFTFINCKDKYMFHIPTSIYNRYFVKQERKKQ